MVVSNPSDKRLAVVSGDEQDTFLIDANHTVEPPPPFSDTPQSGPSCLVGSAAVPQESPPEFALYDADYFETSDGNIVSHDPHLNSDGEALYRFLLAHADKPPSYRLHCRGTHVEHRSHWVTQRANDGSTTSHHETRSETVTDFDFCIEINPPYTIKPIHWSVTDIQPAYRGHMVRETESLGNTQRAKRSVERKYLKWAEERMARGFPPWASNTGWSEDRIDDGVDVLQSSKSVRQWADDYCASQKYLKEFVYEKVLYGWDIQGLESFVRDSIARTMYQGTIEVNFQRHGAKIYIRPDNRLSRILSNKWLKFLSIVLCVFPFIWLFKRFHSRGGGRWEVCGGAYAFKRWEAVPRGDVVLDNGDTSPGYTVQAGFQKRLVGVLEIEWIQKWEGTILRLVRGRYQSSTPIFNPTDDTHTGDAVFHRY